MKNMQNPMKIDHVSSGELFIHSIFKTIQGEGPFVGQPAVFIRLGGCNLACPLCDTDYTTGAKGMKLHAIQEEVDAKATPNKLVVITGGEPFRQKIDRLVHLLILSDYRVQIETNGTIYLPEFPYHLVTLICSPKDNKVDPRLSWQISAYKFVMHYKSINNEDGLPIAVLANPTGKEGVSRPNKNFKGEIFLQPADSKNPLTNQKNLSACIESCLKYGYTLCLQTHKITNME